MELYAVTGHGIESYKTSNGMGQKFVELGATQSGKGMVTTLNGEAEGPSNAHCERGRRGRDSPTRFSGLRISYFATLVSVFSLDFALDLTILHVPVTSSRTCLG